MSIQESPSQVQEKMAWNAFSLQLWISLNQVFSWNTSIPNHIPIFQPPPTSMPPSLQITWTPSSVGIENPKVVQGGSLGGSRQCLACFKRRLPITTTKRANSKKSPWTTKMQTWKDDQHPMCMYFVCVCLLLNNTTWQNLETFSKTIVGLDGGRFSLPYAKKYKEPSLEIRDSQINLDFYQNQKLFSGCIASLQSVHIP